MRFKFAAKLRFTLAAIQDDEVLEEPRLVVVEGLHLDRATGAAARGQEAVAIGVRSRADVLNEWALRTLGSADDERNDTAAVQEDEPSDRSREDEIALAVLEVCVPAHLLRKCKVAKQSAHDIGKDIDGRLASLANSIREIGQI